LIGLYDAELVLSITVPRHVGPTLPATPLFHECRCTTKGCLFPCVNNLAPFYNHYSRKNTRSRTYIARLFALVWYGSNGLRISWEMSKPMVDMCYKSIRHIIIG